MNPDEEKGKLRSEGLAEKERYNPGMEEVGDRIPDNSKYNCWQMMTV